MTNPWICEPTYQPTEDRNLAIAALVVGTVGLLKAFREPGLNPQLLALMQPTTPLPSFSGGPGLALMTPAVVAGPASLREIEQSDLLHARVLFENVAQTIIARHTFPAAGAQAVVIPALRQSGTGFDITVPAPTAPDSLVLLSNKRLPPLGTAIGDMLFWNGTDWVRLPASTAGFVLRANGAAVAPSYQVDTQATINVFEFSFVAATGTFYGRAAQRDFNATPRNTYHNRNNRAVGVTLACNPTPPVGVTLRAEVMQRDDVINIPNALPTPFFTQVTNGLINNETTSLTGSQLSAVQRYSNIAFTISGGNYTGTVLCQYSMAGGA